MKISNNAPGSYISRRSPPPNLKHFHMITKIKYNTIYSRTWILYTQEEPTSTPGIAPKWSAGTMVQLLVRPAHAYPLPQSLQHHRNVNITFNSIYLFRKHVYIHKIIQYKTKYQTIPRTQVYS